jgi:hypothetical protein
MKLGTTAGPEPIALPNCLDWVAANYAEPAILTYHLSAGGDKVLGEHNTSGSVP